MLAKSCCHHDIVILQFFALLLPGVTFSLHSEIYASSTPPTHTRRSGGACLSKTVAEPSKRIHRMVELNRQADMPEAEITKVWPQLSANAGRLFHVHIQRTSPCILARRLVVIHAAIRPLWHAFET